MADVAEELEAQGFKRTLKDLFSGAVGGVAQVLIGESSSSQLSILFQGQITERIWQLRFSKTKVTFHENHLAGGQEA